MSKIKAITTTFEDLMKDVRDGKVKVPTFQRDFVWQQKDIILLLDSIYRKYPIGSFIFWKTDKKLDHHREICGRALKDIAEGKDINYVLDGQQRITSLYSAIEHGRKDNNACIYFFDLKEDRFDYELVEYEHNPEKTKEQNEEAEMILIKQKHKKLEENNRIPLNKIFVDAPTYSKYMMTFPLEFQEKVHILHGTFTNYPFSIIELTEETDFKKICRIFDRINNTGKKLSIVSLMVARSWAEGFDLRSKLNNVRSKFEDFGEISEVTILQSAAVILNDKKCKSKEIDKNLNINDLRDNWTIIEKSLELAVDYLRDNFKIAKIAYLPFDSVIVVLAYVANKKNDLSAYNHYIRLWFWNACLANRYDKSKEKMIEDDCKKFDGVLSGQDIKFDYEISWDLLRSKIIEQRYYLGNAFCKTILTLYAHQRPRDFDDEGTELNLSETFSRYNKKNMHHAFARGYFSKLRKKCIRNNDTVGLEEIENEMKHVESIANIMFIPFRLNNRIKCEEPKIYFNELSKVNNFDKILQSHFIIDLDGFGINDNNFPKFLEKRADFIEKKFGVLTGKISKISDEIRENPSKPLRKIEIELRKTIDEKLKEKYGVEYWLDDKIIPSDIREKVKTKINEEIKRNPYTKDKYNTTFSKLEFCDIMDYPKIIYKNKDVFEKLFPSQENFETHFKNLNYFRNPIAHSHTKLNEVAELNGRAALIWFSEILGLDNKKGSSK